MFNDESRMIFHDQQAVRTTKVACDDGKQKLYHVNQPLAFSSWERKVKVNTTYSACLVDSPRDSCGGTMGKERRPVGAKLERCV